MILPPHVIYPELIFAPRFHKECDQTISDYILSCRMEHAKKLLQYSSLPICEIADQCGFGDASYFTKCFVKHIGIGPEKWKGNTYKKEIIHKTPFYILFS